MIRRITLFLILSFPLAAAPVIRSGAGASAAFAARDQFRVDLSSARREITWDDVPDEFADPHFLPEDYFNVNSPRGVIIHGQGPLVVSANASTGIARFVRFNPEYPTDFRTASPERLFMSLGFQTIHPHMRRNSVGVSFFQPGTTTPATVSGFGAFFTDVDDPAATTITYYDVNGHSLGTFTAPPANQDLSFLGVSFDGGERVASVWVNAGNMGGELIFTSPPDVSGGGQYDMVAMDDFIYSEPLVDPATVPATSPALLALLAITLFSIAMVALRR